MKPTLDHYPVKLWIRVTLLALSFVVLLLLSSTNAVKLKDEYVPKPSQGELSKELKELIQQEHATAVGEIKTSLEQMDTWYHYKFILIGGVIALFLGHFSLLGKQEESAAPRSSERLLETVLVSNRTGAMLTLICVVAFVIDMHIRSNINGIQHLGQWISNYVEPVYLQASVDTAGVRFIPWETFIRLPKETSSTIYTISFSIQLHYMTMIGYILFLVVFQNVSMRNKRANRQQIAVIGFVLVHLSLLAFIIVAHTVRDTFNVGCFPLIPLKVCSLSGSQGSTYYVIAWLFLIVLNLPYLYPPLSRLHSGMRATEPEAATPNTSTDTI
ncbi:MAG TPA: hypothetical protein VJT09_01370 [Pyrinomonadaceae bacterium]|nr:hypothetical protein [Pyrinomonadaceae bacterium]